MLRRRASFTVPCFLAGLSNHHSQYNYCTTKRHFVPGSGGNHSPLPHPPHEDSYYHQTHFFSNQQQQSHNQQQYSSSSSTSSSSDSSHQNQQPQQQYPSEDEATKSRRFWSTLPLFFLIGFVFSYIYDKFEDIFISPCNTMAKYLREDGVALLTSSKNNRYHDPMFRESIVLMTYVGPSGAEGLIINKPIQHADFEREIRSLKQAKALMDTASDSKIKNKNKNKNTKNESASEDQEKEKEEEADDEKKLQQKEELQTLLDAVNKEKKWEVENIHNENKESVDGADLHSLLEALTTDKQKKHDDDDPHDHQNRDDNAQKQKDVTTSPTHVLRAFSLPRPLPNILQTELAANPVFCGGPMLVEQNIVNLLHPLKNVTGSLQVAPGLYLGGDQEQIKKSLRQGKIKPEDVLVVLGSSSWAPKQLFSEWRRSSWEFHVGSKDETNLTNVCRKINRTVTRADPENQEDLPKQRVLSRHDLYLAMKQMFADDVAKREMDFAKLVRWKRKSSSSTTTTTTTTRDGSDNDSIEAVAAAAAEDKLKNQEDQKIVAEATPDEVSKIMTPFVSSAFFGERENQISKEIWEDHYECLANTTSAKKGIKTALLGKCLTTNLKKAQAFGKVVSPGDS